MIKLTIYIYVCVEISSICQFYLFCLFKSLLNEKKENKKFLSLIFNTHIISSFQLPHAYNLHLYSSLNRFIKNNNNNNNNGKRKVSEYVYTPEQCCPLFTSVYMFNIWSKKREREKKGEWHTIFLVFGRIFLGLCSNFLFSLLLLLLLYTFVHIPALNKSLIRR